MVKQFVARNEVRWVVSDPGCGGANSQFIANWLCSSSVYEPIQIRLGHCCVTALMESIVSWCRSKAVQRCASWKGFTEAGAHGLTSGASGGTRGNSRHI